MNMDFKSAEELLNLCEENQLPISEVMRQRECLLGEVPRDSVNHRMGKAWENDALFRHPAAEKAHQIHGRAHRRGGEEAGSTRCKK